MKVKMVLFLGERGLLMLHCWDV